MCCQWCVVGWPDFAAVTCWESALMPVYSSLTHALAEALVDVLWFIEGTEDEQMDPDDAVKVMEGVATWSASCRATSGTS